MNGHYTNLESKMWKESPSIKDVRVVEKKSDTHNVIFMIMKMPMMSDRECVLDMVTKDLEDGKMLWSI